MSNLSFVRHKGDGVTNQFALSVAGENIGYFRISDIHGYVDDKEVPITIDPNSPHIVRFTETPKLNADILIRRQMPVKKTYADFERGNNFGHRQVNNTFVQQLYLTQELLDGFFPSGFYFKQDVDLGGHKITNLGDATEDSDAVNKKVTDSLNKRLESLENSVSGNSRFLPWTYNAVGGEDALKPPYNFESARVFINGVRQRAGESFEVVDLTIMLAEPLEEGDWVDVELGTEPKDFIEQDISNHVVTVDGETNTIVAWFKKFLFFMKNLGKQLVTSSGSLTPRSLENRFSDIINVADYGAVGDGVHNDTAAIKLAVKSAVSSDKNLYFEQKEYLVTEDIVAELLGKTLIIFGSGATLKVATPFSGVSARGLFIKGASTQVSSCVEVYNLHVDGSLRGGVLDNDGSDTITGIRIGKCNNVRVQSCVVTSVMGKGIEYSEVINGSIDNCRLRNCWGLNRTPDPAYDNYGDGIHIITSENISVTNTIIRNDSNETRPARGGIVFEFSTKHSRIEGCEISGYDRCIHFEGDVDFSSVRNCRIDRYNTGIITSGDTSSNIVFDNVTFMSGLSGFQKLIGPSAILYIHAGSDNIKIHNCEFQYKSGTDNSIIINNPVAKNVRFSDCLFWGDTGEFYVNAGVGLTIYNCAFEEFNKINFADETRDVVISACRFRNTIIEANSVKNIKIDKSTFYENSRIRMLNTRNGSSITNCSFFDITGTGAVIDNYTSGTSNLYHNLEISNNFLSCANAGIQSTRLVAYDPYKGQHCWYSAGVNQVFDASTGKTTKVEHAFVEDI